MQIKSDFPISKSSVATIYESGLIGGKQIMIVPNLKDQNMTVTGDHLQKQYQIRTYRFGRGKISAVAGKRLDKNF